MTFLISVIALLAIAIFVFLQHPKFGKYSSGERLLKIKQSPNYKNGSFQNLSHTPALTEGMSYWAVGKEFLFEKKPNMRPAQKIPSVKTDLLHLPEDKDILVWFGHSSYFMQIDGKKMLVDPVFSGSVSPLPVGSKSFEGTDVYSTDDLPEIDFLFISHDHWDHLDYETIKKLRPKIKKVICGLGVGAHLAHWGYTNEQIIEKDWNEEIALAPNFRAHTVSARHFSGRGLLRNRSLWVSYVLQTPTMQIFIGGDSGYDSHFVEIGKKFGTFDLVILENGQYDKKWRYIHLLPEEILEVAKQLNAKRILPVHHSKFVLGNHAWSEPLELITQHNETQNLHIITPIIGEQVRLHDHTQVFGKWWQSVV